MAPKNKVLQSINLDGETQCVDIYQRPDGSYGFEEFRRDTEDNRGWFPIGFYGEKKFDSEETAWNIAQERLGPQIAAAAIALIYDKFNAGEVASPGGYLRGMVEKAGAGELHLDRSFYGRLNEVRVA